MRWDFLEEREMRGRKRDGPHRGGETLLHVFMDMCMHWLLWLIMFWMFSVCHQWTDNVVPWPGLIQSITAPTTNQIWFLFIGITFWRNIMLMLYSCLDHFVLFPLQGWILSRISTQNQKKRHYISLKENQEYRTIKIFVAFIVMATYHIPPLL